MKKRPLFSLLLLTIFAFTMSATEYHVSKDGDDSNEGSETSPFLTVSKAAELAIAGDVVIIHEGTYEETLRPANSGEVDAPIVFRSAQGERVILTAMQALSGFELDGGDIYKTAVDWDLGQENFVMNASTAMDLARWPNNDDGDPFSLNSKRNDGGSPAETERDAFLTDSEIPDIDWTGGSIFFYGDRPGSGWLAWKEFITSSSSGRVNFNIDKRQNWIRTFHPPADKGDFFLEGVKGALDFDNEWWYDDDNEMLYVQLPGGKSPADGQVKMRRRKLTVNLNQRDHIHLENFALFGGSVEIEGDGNRMYGMSSWYGSYTQGITRNFLTNISAVFIKFNATNTVIEKCELGFGAGTGLRDAGDDTRIENNYIHDFDFLGSYDGPVIARDGNRTLITKNTIRRGGRDAIQIVNKNSRISFNDISQSNLIADDCALIYTVDMGLEMEIDHNWIHDTKGRGTLKKAAGIYLDSGPGQVRLHHNVIYDTEWSSVQMNLDATDIEVYNNTLWDAAGAFGAWHKEGTEFSNVKIYNNLQNNRTEEAQADKKNNRIMSSSSTPFNDEEALDFTLQAGSSAIDFGIEIPGITDGFKGDAPDAGAYEDGAERWLAGVDWDITRGAAGQCYELPGEVCRERSTPTKDIFGESAGTLELFPNPTEDKIYIKDLKLHNILRMYDNQGRQVMDLIRSNVFFEGINVSGLNPGMYIIQDEEGRVAKFVKK